MLAVVIWGCAATTWLAKAFNSHPEILCLHSGLKRIQTEYPIQYYSTLVRMGLGYAAVGDVHGISRSDIPKLKEICGLRFHAAIVIREPLARIRSHMALYNTYIPGTGPWNFCYTDSVIQMHNLIIRSEAEKMFVHALNMLNAVVEEAPLGTIYKTEELTTDPDCLRNLVQK